MQIILNGEPFELQKIAKLSEKQESGADGTDSVETLAKTASVACLVAQRQLNPRQIAVEVNGRLIPREDYEKALLAKGDSVEVVTLAGGG